MRAVTQTQLPAGVRKNQEASIEAPLCHWGDFYRISEKRQKEGNMLKLGFVLCPPYPSVFLLPSIVFFSVPVTSAARPAGEVEAVYL